MNVAASLPDAFVDALREAAPAAVGLLETVERGYAQVVERLTSLGAGRVPRTRRLDARAAL